jgi:queuine tRNA-ribosyltransferase
MAVQFELVNQDGAARAGKLTTPRGEIKTPVFMPVGTQGMVKGVRPRELVEAGASIILCNTYHMMLRPGEETVAKLGGLHRFNGWDGPILTDSGGFQVYSLSGLRKLDNDGVTFRSHLDGSQYRLTPERSIEIQCRLGSDIMMSFDECPPYDATREDVARATSLSGRWAKRSKLAAAGGPGELFGIVQGGIYEDLRRESAEELVDIGFAGYAIGGLSVGEPKNEMMETVEATVPWLPGDKPRYLMGVGTPQDLLEAVERGIDMFDCVMPTRNARNGTLFTSQGKISVKQARYREEESPPDPNCDCPVCRKYSLAYLRHLYMSGEILASVYNSMHNLYFYLGLMQRARQAIIDGRYEKFKQETLAQIEAGEKERAAG